MSKSWTSYEKDGKLMESWRQHLAGEPEPIEELFGRKKREDKWAAIAGGDEPQKKVQKCPPGCCPCEEEAEEEYPATHFTDLFKTVDDVNRRLGQGGLDKNTLFKELEQLFKDQNFVVQEGLLERRGAPGEIEGAATALARHPVYDLSKYPTLAKLVQTATQDAALAKALSAAFVAAGFEGVNIAPATAPQPPEEEEEEEEALTGGGEEEKPLGPTDQGAGLTDIGGGPGGEEAPTDGGGEDTPAAAADAISVYKGKGGVGLQSILDKSGIPGNIKSAVLKHIVTQLQKQGMEVQEIVNSGFPANLVEIAGPPSAEDQEEFASLGGSDAPAADTPATGAKPKSKNPQIAVYNHPAGKKFSLNQALQDAGYTGGDLGKLLDAIAQWGKAQGLKINEDIFASLRDEMLIESRLHRWQQLIRG